MRLEIKRGMVQEIRKRQMKYFGHIKLHNFYKNHSGANRGKASKSLHVAVYAFPFAELLNQILWSLAL